MSQDNDDHHHSNNEQVKEFSYKNSKSFVEISRQPDKTGFRPVRWFLGGMMYLYQNIITDQYFSACIYDPSCSNFSKHAISEYGWVKGVFLSADRLQRCNSVGASYEPQSGDTFSNRRKDTPDRYRIK